MRNLIQVCLFTPIGILIGVLFTANNLMLDSHLGKSLGLVDQVIRLDKGITAPEKTELPQLFVYPQEDGIRSLPLNLLGDSINFQIRSVKSGEVLQSSALGPADKVVYLVNNRLDPDKFRHALSSFAENQDLSSDSAKKQRITVISLSSNKCKVLREDFKTQMREYRSAPVHCFLPPEDAELARLLNSLFSPVATPSWSFGSVQGFPAYTFTISDFYSVVVVLLLLIAIILLMIAYLLIALEAKIQTLTKSIHLIATNQSNPQQNQSNPQQNQQNQQNHPNQQNPQQSQSNQPNQQNPQNQSNQPNQQNPQQSQSNQPNQQNQSNQLNQQNPQQSQPNSQQK